jgi:hypothetical protein
VGAPEHTIEPSPDGGFLVRVDGSAAGTVAGDSEYPGLWKAWDQVGQFLGRRASQEEAATLLATWFVVKDQDWL